MFSLYTVPRASQNIVETLQLDLIWQRTIQNNPRLYNPNITFSAFSTSSFGYSSVDVRKLSYCSRVRAVITQNTFPHYLEVNTFADTFYT